MTVKRPAFTSTRTEEERALDKSEVITLKLNPLERDELEADKELCDINGDGPMIKLLVDLGRKVLRDQIPAHQIQYLVSLRRTRYTGRKKRPLPEIPAQSNTKIEP